MPTLKEFFDIPSGDLVIEIRIPAHEINTTMLDTETLSKVCDMDKETSMAKRIEGILYCIDYVEKIMEKTFDIKNNPLNVYSNTGGAFVTTAYATTGRIWSNRSQNKKHYAQSNLSIKMQAHHGYIIAGKKPVPPKQPSRFKPFNHCFNCKRRNGWGLVFCDACGEVLDGVTYV